MKLTEVVDIPALLTQRVESPELVEHVGHQVITVIPVTDMGSDRNRATTGRFVDLSCGDLTGVEFSGGHHHVGTRFGEPLRVARPMPRDPPVTSATLPVSAAQMLSRQLRPVPSSGSVHCTSP